MAAQAVNLVSSHARRVDQELEEFAAELAINQRQLDPSDAFGAHFSPGMSAMASTPMAAGPGGFGKGSGASGELQIIHVHHGDSRSYL